jgi:hypothetical protein
MKVITSNLSHDLHRANSISQNFGYLKITGTLSRTAIPGQAIIRLYDRKSGKIISATHSSKTGKYAFNNISYATYTVVAIDQNMQYNAVVQDMVVPK